MTLREMYEEAMEMEPVCNHFNNSRKPSFAEYKKAVNEGRIVQTDKKCIIVSNEATLQFTLYAR